MGQVHPLTRAELARAAEKAFRRTFPELAKHGPAAITERTIRFWTHQRLLPRRGKPNQAALYEPEILDQCVFVRRLQVEKALTIEDIRKVLETVDQVTIKRVAEGREPLRVEFALSPIGESRIGSNEQVVVLREEKNKMLAASHDRQPRRDDRPIRLRALSDSDKEDAVADALQRCTTREFAVDIRAVDYSGRFLERGSFRSPARIECDVFGTDTKEDEKNTVEVIRGVSDTTMSAAIAAELSARSGESYLVELLRKKYDADRTKRVGLELVFLVATADGQALINEPKEHAKNEMIDAGELESAIVALRDTPAGRRHSDSGVRCGVYAIRLDTAGALGLALGEDRGLLYVGMSTDLSVREFDTHFDSAQTGFSTVRRSIGSILKQELGLTALARGLGRSKNDFTNFRFEAAGEDRLTAWMRQHLSVSTWPTPRYEPLERDLIQRLRPPLNLEKGNPKNEVVRSLRKLCADEARASAAAKSRRGGRGS